MALVRLMTSPALVLAAIAMLVTYQGVPIHAWSPPISRCISPTGPAQADGYYFAASAIGSVLGCLIAGFLADTGNYNTVNWMAAVAGITATGCVCPLLRRGQAGTG
jgi:predicted MFS family arabinose efflux permease